MTRAIIAGVVAAVILGLTMLIYMLVSERVDNQLAQNAETRALKGAELIVQNSKLELLTLQRRTEKLARDENLFSALNPKLTDAETFELVTRALTAYRAAGGGKTQMAALLDREGNMIVLQLEDRFDTVTNTKMWKRGDGWIHPAIGLALRPDPAEAQSIADIIDLGKGPMTVGVAPIIDLKENEVAGAIVVAHSLGAPEAQRAAALLGGEVVYFNGDKPVATSATRTEARQEDTTRYPGIQSALTGTGVGKEALDSEQGLSRKAHAGVDGEKYVIAAGRLWRFTSAEKFPADYPKPSVGALVLFSLDNATAPVSSVKVGILALGGLATLVALLALFLAQRRITHQADELESGINEVINGNLELTFRPVGAELDGLANALNVMLARLLGRPEPGEEEYDEEGNVIQRDRLAFDTELSEKDTEAVALAQEAEPDYYKRLFHEYVAAREEAGENVEGVTFDSFVTKLRVNEAGLKKKYQCSAVRFKVVTRDGKVSLKPVPIV
ncbi:MAG TPA: MXAN_5187 C-terminal domain-containing protein [Kofleriaceae bacterium]|nr:MXAN_5187 C-terminal domain-containing protein [Kofleriaceae bacterium]